MITSFTLAANYFKRDIKAMAIRRSLEKGNTRSYLFTDNTFCTYDINGDFFKFKPE